jgi:ketosteroid isomerase-like protein
MPHGDITEQDVAELVARTSDAAKAFIRGDMTRYLELIEHSSDYTLMAPTGGESRYGFDRSPESVAATARSFQGGEAELEVVASYVSGDLVVLVAVERQHGNVGGLPEQDWSLRVTLVFRRAGSGWQLVHRHADPLVHDITFEELARLAHG